MRNTVKWLGYIFGYHPETVYATNTYQFRDYSRYDAALWDEQDKKLWQEQQLPKDCERAFEIGRKIAE